MSALCIILKKYFFVNSIEIQFDKYSRKNDVVLVLYQPPSRHYEIIGELTTSDEGVNLERTTTIYRVGNQVLTTVYYSVSGKLAFVIRHNGFSPTWFGRNKLGEKYLSPTKYDRKIISAVMSDQKFIDRFKLITSWKQKPN
jgi:hypothetical protein